jgi:hypothetical protein
MEYLEKGACIWVSEFRSFKTHLVRTRRKKARSATTKEKAKKKARKAGNGVCAYQSAICSAFHLYTFVSSLLLLHIIYCQ